MAKSLSVTGLAFRVALFLGRHPEESLTSADIAVKFGVSRLSDVSCLLRPAVEAEILDMRKAGRHGTPHPATYSAGPALMALIGVAMQACAPMHHESLG